MTETLLRVRREDGCACEPKWSPKAGWAMRDLRGVRCEHGSTVETVEYALPEGTYSVSWEAEGVARFIELCGDGQWSLTVTETKDPWRLIADGYAPTFEDAWKAIADAEERWREGD